jgi:hypothetical protein
VTVRIALLVAAALACTTSALGASAKEFEPGTLRVCDREECVPILDEAVLPHFSSFYYTGPRPRTARAPRRGAPTFEVRFSNGYVTGIVASRRLDRFLSYGVYVGRFRSGTWYRLPPRAAAELRRLAANLEPLPLTAAAVARSR